MNLDCTNTNEIEIITIRAWLGLVVEYEEEGGQSDLLGGVGASDGGGFNTPFWVLSWGVDNYCG